MVHHVPDQQVDATDADEPVVSVADLARRIRHSLEQVTGREWIEGEIASFKRAASGHLYFSLKDEREEALVECVAYRSQALSARRVLVEGARVQIQGKATLWAPRGRLQLVVERARAAGRGALLEALEKLKQRLAAEGFFEAARKRSLPEEPRVIGIVTSAAGAAVHDVIAVAFRRGGAHLVLAPALVQGEGAAKSIVEAIDALERLPDLDVLIVGRGGGSGEDLMAFNDERVVRRVASTRVPVVSAVGHDIDVTLADLAADVRAATPSQAAELVVVDSGARRSNLMRSIAALQRAAERRLLDDRATLQNLRGRLTDPRFLIADRQQRVDELLTRLGAAVRRSSRARRAPLDRLSHRLAARHPRSVVGSARAAHQVQLFRLHTAARGRLDQARRVVLDRTSRLEGLSPLAVLSRGYAIATRLNGRAVRGPDELSPGESFHLRLERGALLAESLGEIAETTNDVDARPRRPRPWK